MWVRTGVSGDLCRESVGDNKLVTDNELRWINGGNEILKSQKLYGPFIEMGS